MLRAQCCGVIRHHQMIGRIVLTLLVAVCARQEERDSPWVVVLKQYCTYFVGGDPTYHHVAWGEFSREEARQEGEKREINGGR